MAQDGAVGRAVVKFTSTIYILQFIGTIEADVRTFELRVVSNKGHVLQADTVTHNLVSPRIVGLIRTVDPRRIVIGENVALTSGLVRILVVVPQLV